MLNIKRFMLWISTFTKNVSVNPFRKFLIGFRKSLIGLRKILKCLSEILNCFFFNFRVFLFWAWFFKPKIIKLQKSYIPQKEAENMYNKDSARKIRFCAGKKLDFFQFFDFSRNAQGFLKFLMFNCPKLLKKNPKMASPEPVRYWKEQSHEFWWA